MQKSRKEDGGFACFEMPVHGLKVDDNPHLTTTTRHVMVGITRSKVILFFIIFLLIEGDVGELPLLILRRHIFDNRLYIN